MSASGMHDNVPGASRFSPITATDHAGYVWIVTIIGITYTTLSFLLRAWIKFRVYGWDDALIAAATVLHAGQATSMLLGLSYGLAKSNTITDPADGPAASKAFFATEVVGLVILCLSKCSVLALMLRVFTPEIGIETGYRACVTLTVVSVAWCIGSVVAITADCGVATLLTLERSEQCPGLYDRRLGITIPEIITDVLICLLPLWVTMKMTKNVRFNVSLGFSFRIFVVPLSALRLYYFRDAAESADAQLAITKSLLFQQAAVTVSLVSATIPNLRTFMKSMNTQFNLPARGRRGQSATRAYALRTFGGSTMVSSGGGGQGGSGSGGGRGENTTIPSLASSSSSRRHHHHGHYDELSLRPDGVHHQASVSHAARPSDATEEEQYSLKRAGSQDGIITKRIEWDVRHDDG